MKPAPVGSYSCRRYSIYVELGDVSADTDSHTRGLWGYSSVIPSNGGGADDDAVTIGFALLLLV